MAQVLIVYGTASRQTASCVGSWGSWNVMYTGSIFMGDALPGTGSASMKPFLPPR